MVDAVAWGRTWETLANERSDLLNLEFAGYTVELALPRVAASGQALVHARRGHLADDVVGVRLPLEDARDRTRVAERDAIGDLEAGVLAHVVDVVRELAHDINNMRKDAGFASDRVPR